MVEDYVKSIDTCKSSGVNGLSSVLLKDALKVLTVELAHILNESIKTCIFPDAWALGTVTPIPKEGDYLDPGNWRPITILPIPSKLLERAVHYQIVNHLDEHNLLRQNQHGFRKGKSTSSAIMEMSQVLFENYNLGLHTSCLFIDYRKAFETLDHSLLLNKLRNFGFSKSSLDWVKSYLGNRRHVVKCGDIMSREVRVEYGVPQGSILGPLYFILYVNDLLDKMSDVDAVTTIMYADDTVLLTSSNSHETTIRQMQNALNILSDWCITNKLTINPKKTKHMLVARTPDVAAQGAELSVNMNGKTLSNVVVYKYLGVNIDNKLSFEEAANDSYLKANRKLFSLKKIRPYVTPQVANLIYKQCILPLLDYADFIIESANLRSIDHLDKVQRRAVRIIDRGLHKRCSTAELEDIYMLKPLKDRRRLHHLSLMYRLAHAGYNLDHDRPNIVLRNRNKIKFYVPTTKLTKVMNSPYYRGVRLWDMLSEDVQRATTKFKFKRLLR